MSFLHYLPLSYPCPHYVYVHHCCFPDMYISQSLVTLGRQLWKKQVRKLVTSTYISLSYFHCGAVAGCIVPPPWLNLTRTFIALCGGLLSTTLLHQAELMHLIQFPLAAKAVDDASYVDDGVTGADSVVSSCRLFSRRPGSCYVNRTPMNPQCSN